MGEAVEPDQWLQLASARTTLWQLDQLSLEVMALFGLMFAPIMVIAATVLGEWLFLIAELLVPFVGMVVLYIYTRWRGHSFVIKKKASPLELHDTPLFADAVWGNVLFGHTMRWLVWSVCISIALLYAQQLLIYHLTFFGLIF